MTGYTEEEILLGSRSLDLHSHSAAPGQSPSDTQAWVGGRWGQGLMMTAGVGDGAGFVYHCVPGP